jgi:hypothetical protein
MNVGPLIEGKAGRIPAFWATPEGQGPDAWGRCAPRCVRSRARHATGCTVASQAGCRPASTPKQIGRIEVYEHCGEARGVASGYAITMGNSCPFFAAFRAPTRWHTLLAVIGK